MKRFGIILLTLLLAACAAPAASLPEPTAAPTAEPTAAPVGEHVLDKLQVVSRPNKVDYYAGETFDPTGLVINALYQDGTVEENVPFECNQTVITGKMNSVTVSCMGKELKISITVAVAGNQPEYSVEETEEVPDSPVKGQKFLWLGSSVTYGAESEQESIADFFGKKYGVSTIKLAVSGTTLATYQQNSYVERLDKYINSPECDAKIDAFICQLSTNDTKYTKQRGTLMPDFITDSTAFDTATACGAIEYIITKAKETWDCPVYFYTNPPTGNALYSELIDIIVKAAEKWDIQVIDLYSDREFNDITEKDRALYLADPIHPTKAGYREWWLPKFEEVLLP